MDHGMFGQIDTDRLAATDEVEDGDALSSVAWQGAVQAVDGLIAYSTNVAPVGQGACGPNAPPNK